MDDAIFFCSIFEMMVTNKFTQVLQIEVNSISSYPPFAKKNRGDEFSWTLLRFQYNSFSAKFLHHLINDPFFLPDKTEFPLEEALNSVGAVNKLTLKSLYCFRNVCMKQAIWLRDHYMQTKDFYSSNACARSF